MVLVAERVLRVTWCVVLVTCCVVLCFVYVCVCVLTPRRSGDLQRAFKLPAGVKCIVGDGPFLYAGCNDGSLYDLTNGVPRLLSKLEAFSEVYWIDIRHGMLAASDAAGSVALVNTEGARAQCVSECVSE